MSVVSYDAAACWQEKDDSCKRICMVEGCTVDVSLESSYCRQRRVCMAHQQASSVKLAGSDELKRFCQQCGKLEELTAFDEGKKSCRAALARRRANHAALKNKKASPAAAAAAPAAAAVSEPLAAFDFIPMVYAPTATPTEVLQDLQTLEVPAAAASAADMTFVSAPGVYGSKLEQQLQLYQQQCAVLRAQVQQLEEEQRQSQAGMAAAVHQAQLTHQTFGSIGSPEQPAPSAAAAARWNLCSPDVSQCRDTITYVPFLPAAAAAPSAVKMESSCSATLCFPARADSCSMLLPRHCRASNSASFPSAPQLSHMGSGIGPAALHSMQQQQLWLQQQQAAMELQQGFASEPALAATGAGYAGACMTPAGPSRCASGMDASTCYSAGTYCSSGYGDWAWQQMMQPPAHVQQMLPAAFGGMSAPLPAGWVGGSASSAVHSAGLVPVMPHMFTGAGMQAHVPAQGAGGAMQGAGGSAGGPSAASQGVMVLGEDDGCDIMDCDSAEDLEGLLEMSLLEAGMKARMGAAGMF